MKRREVVKKLYERLDHLNYQLSVIEKPCSYKCEMANIYNFSLPDNSDIYDSKEIELERRHIGKMLRLIYDKKH